MLISYIVESLEDVGSKVKVLEKGQKLAVNGLEAARHVKSALDSVPNVPHGKGRISYNIDTDNSRYWQAFPVPPPGIKIEFQGELDPYFLGYFGVALQDEQVYNVDTWRTAEIASASVANAANDLGLSLNAAAAFINWDDGKVSLEVWEKQQMRNDIIGGNVEVGLLKIDEISEPHDIVLAGRARILPEDTQSSPIMFHRIPTWRQTNDTARASFSGGMHPNLILNIDTKAPADTCVLYAHLKLPPAVFIDQYQLQDLPDMTPPSELMGVWGSTDLEAPVWLITQGSQALIRLDEPSNYSIPLHLRYEVPDYVVPRWMPAPEVFWACKDTLTYEPWAIETFFPKGTSFYSLRSNGVEFTIPTIDTQSQPFVERVTGFVVLIGTLLVLLSLFKISTKKQAKAKAD